MHSNIILLLFEGPFRKVINLVDPLANIADEVGEWIGVKVAEAFEAFADIVDIILEGISEVGGINGKFGSFYTYIDSHSHFFTGEGYLLQAMQAIGFVIIFLCFAFFLVSYMRDPEKSQQTLWDAIIRTVLATAIVGGGKNAYLYMTNMAGTLCSAFSKTANGHVPAMHDLTPLVKVIATDAVQERGGEILLYGGTAGLGAATAGAVADGYVMFSEATTLLLFGNLILFLIVWPLIKNYIRLALEMLERYIVFILLTACFPAIAGSIALKETEGVFKSYIKTMLGQIILLVTIGLLVFMGANIIVTPAVVVAEGGSAIMSYLFALGYFRVAQRFDAYISALGFSVGQTFGGIADSLGGAVRGLGNMVRSVNNTRQNVGQGMMAIGARSGNSGIFKAGQILGSSFRQPPASAATQNRMFAAAVAQNDRTASVPASQGWTNTKQALHSPLHSKDMLDFMNQGSRSAALAHGLAGTGISDIHDVKWGAGGAIDFKGYDSNGNLHDYALDTKDNGLSKALGDGIYLNSKDRLGEGDHITGNADSVLASNGAVGLEDKIGDIAATIDSAEVLANGTVAFKAEDETIGTMVGDKYFANDTLTDENHHIKDDYEDAIYRSLSSRMDGYNLMRDEETGNFLEYDERTGKYFATLYNEQEPNQQQRVDIHILGNDVSDGRYDKKWAVNTRSSSDPGQKIKIIFETNNKPERTDK